MFKISKQNKSNYIMQYNGTYLYKQIKKIKVVYVPQHINWIQDLPQSLPTT